MIRYFGYVIIAFGFIPVLSCLGFSADKYVNPSEDTNAISLFVSRSTPSRSDDVKLHALDPEIAVEASIILYGIPLTSFHELNGNTMVVGTEGMKQKIKRWVEEVDAQVSKTRVAQLDSQRLDRFWCVVSYWAAAYDSFASYNQLNWRLGDTLRFKRAFLKTYFTLDSLSIDPNQKARRPIILLFLGHFAQTLKRYEDANNYFKTVLFEYPEQRERCIVAEYGLSRTLKMQGDSILSRIPTKYSDLNDFKELLGACPQKVTPPNK